MSMWLPPLPPVLASKSEARRNILVSAGLPVEIVPAAIDERTIERALGNISADEIALRLAAEKAKSAATNFPARVVIGADQILTCGETRFAKPADRVAAGRQLRALRGKTHLLHSAVAVVCDDDILFWFADTARLTMRDFSDCFIESYLDTIGADATASVGAYQMEKIGVHLFERVEGDHFTILGLPLLPLLKFFRHAGFVPG